MISLYGLKFIAIGAVLTVALILFASAKDSTILYILSLVSAVLTVSLIFFYRNPSRHIPDGQNLVLSIADGKVLSVDKIQNDYVGGEAWKISIFLSVFYLSYLFFPPSLFFLPQTI